MTDPDDPDNLLAALSWAPIFGRNRVWAELADMYRQGLLSSWPPDAHTVAAVIHRLFPAGSQRVKKMESIPGIPDPFRGQQACGLMEKTQKEIPMTNPEPMPAPVPEPPEYPDNTTHDLEESGND